MVAQDHDVIVAEIGHQPLTLLELLGDALVVVVADAAIELQGKLVERQQPFPKAGNRNARAGVGMQHALSALPSGMNGPVDDETGGIERWKSPSLNSRPYCASR